MIFLRLPFLLFDSGSIDQSVLDCIVHEFMFLLAKSAKNLLMGSYEPFLIPLFDCHFPGSVHEKLEDFEEYDKVNH